MRSRGWVVLVGIGATLVGACRPPAPASVAMTREAGLRLTDEAIVRGAPLYAAYCAGCHGPRGAGNGEVALALDLRPADLRDPAVLAASDDALVERLLQGTPLAVPAGESTLAEAIRVDALEAYLPTLPATEWEVIRAGRVVYEGECAACHGPYGEGDGVIGIMMKLPPASLLEARERYGDEALAGVSVNGVGAMPPMAGQFEPGEVRALIAYVRHLSPGYRLYDTYCALCHGDDGRGIHPEDLLPPGTAAPPLDPAVLASRPPAARRATILHMLRREQGAMPHFRAVLDAAALRDVVAYVRMVGS